MARAIATDMRERMVNGDTITFTFGVQFYGSDVQGGAGDYDLVSFDVALADTTNTIGSKFVTAIRNRATELGYTLPNNAVLIPVYTKG